MKDEIYIAITLDLKIPAHAKAWKEYNDHHKMYGTIKEQWAIDKVAPDTDQAISNNMQLKVTTPAIEVRGQARQEREDV